MKRFSKENGFVGCFFKYHPKQSTYFSVSSKESVRDGNVDVERQRSKQLLFHLNQLLLLICIVTNVQEIIKTRGMSFLK